MQIPPHLLTYNEDRWLPEVEESVRLPNLRAREKWRQAQDAWANQNGIDRTQFEQLRQQQKENQT
jgi:hypothetical protein